jgi:hypothetical protein
MTKTHADRSLLTDDEREIFANHVAQRDVRLAEIIRNKSLAVDQIMAEKIGQAFRQATVSMAQMGVALHECIERSHRFGGAASERAAYELGVLLDNFSTPIESTQTPPPAADAPPSPLLTFEAGVRSKRDAIFREMFGITEQHDIWGNPIDPEPEAVPQVAQSSSASVYRGEGGPIFISGGSGGSHGNSITITAGSGGSGFGSCRSFRCLPSNPLDEPPSNRKSGA